MTSHSQVNDYIFFNYFLWLMNKEALLSRNQRFIEAVEMLINLGMVKNSTKFSESIGVNSTNWSKYKKNERLVTDDIINSATNRYALSRDYIERGEGEPIINNWSQTTNDHSFKARDISRATGMQVVTHGGVGGEGSQVQILAMELENLKQVVANKDALLAYKDELIKELRERIEELKERIRELKER
ncbi:hypothetical protein [Rufibacter latericius]|uniref:Uncharacterized protein n=1 Tax=Rufibacter latericius TaxID=2487040 RepID=A0A3M9MPG6_9BACT|nr:hypothetical protein [Rufibacter latericius]RNI26588.1 hypothetical protein EFB08_11255 [Rufibacter latericius]